MDKIIPKKRSSNWLKGARNIIFILFVFGLGFMLGNGIIQFGGLKSQQKNLPQNLDYATVEKVYDSLRQSFDGQLDVDKLLDGLKHGLTRATGDPYTDYLSPKEAQEFTDQLNGTFQGIGAKLSKDGDGNLIVVSPIDGFPAQKAGLKPKDIIAAINDELTQNMSVDQAVNKIRGKKGTVVTLKIIRGNSGQIIKITRDEIKIPSVKSKILPGNIGYLQITQFSGDTVELTTKAANDFKKAGVKGVVLDLRGDPGGELNAAVGVSSLWLKKGKTVLTERRDKEIIQTYKADSNSILAGFKTVVLIDEGSASASEITAGALRDNNVATLMGVKSFGKGSVQQIVSFRDGSELKVTIARWYTPAGKNIDKQGITPDKEVKRTNEDIKAGKDPQLDAATNFLNQ